MKIRLNTDWIKLVIAILAVLLFLLGVVLGIRSWEKSRSKVPQDVLDARNAEREREEWVEFDGLWYVPKKHLETTLILGVDKYADETRADVQGDYAQADFLLLLVVNRDTETGIAIHLNRDTMTDIQILTDAGAVARTFEGQLTLAHTYGGTEQMNCENTVIAASKLLYGVEIDHYLSLTMDGVAKMNDLVGGVTVEVMDDFTGIDDSLVKGQEVTLKGSQALTYVRARRGLEDGSNTHRMERQRQYLEALQRQLTIESEKDEDFTLSTLMELNEYMASDLSVEQLSDLSNRIQKYGVAEYHTLEGEIVVGNPYVEFYPDEEKLRELVTGIFYDQVGED